jgi:5-(aminomethyl)-3-furanmethanol phosphate kinase
MADLVVVKVGGSLFDHPGLGPGLRRWAGLASCRLLFIPGGGPAANVVRQYHHTHQPPEAFSHWLAIRMMDANGQLLRQLLTNSAEVPSVTDFCRQDEGNLLSLPHNWKTTSDAIAARVAELFDARELVMLKSIDLPNGISWTEAAKRGLVDWTFGDVVERSGLAVRWVNFRELLDIG